MIKAIAPSFLFFALLAVMGPQGFAQPALSSTLFDQAEANYRKADYDKAITQYTAYLRLRPDSSAGWFNRGLCYYYKAVNAPTRELYEKAATDFSQAIKLDPKTADNWMFRGHVYSRLMVVDFKRSLDQAVADYTKAIELNPKLAAAYAGRGMVYEDSNQLDKALADLNTAIRLNPTDPVAFYTRAKVQNFKKNRAAARADINSALRLSPNYEAAKVYARYLDDEDIKARQAAASVQPTRPAVTPKPSVTSSPAARSVPSAAATPSMSAAAAGGPNVGDLYKQAEDAAAANAHARVVDITTRGLRQIPLDGELTRDELLAIPYLHFLLMRARAQSALGKHTESDADFQTAGLAAMQNTLRHMDAANAKLATETGSGGAIILASLESFKATQLCKLGFNGMNDWIAAVKKSRPNDTSLGLKAGITSLGLREICSQAHIVLGGVLNSKSRAFPQQTAKTLDEALAAFNEAVTLTPRDPKAYQGRAAVYRQMGRTALAEADEKTARGLPAPRGQ